jgi:hypothetical protein
MCNFRATGGNRRQRRPRHQLVARHQSITNPVVRHHRAPPHYLQAIDFKHKKVWHSDC